MSWERGVEARENLQSVRMALREIEQDLRHAEWVWIGEGWEEAWHLKIVCSRVVAIRFITVSTGTSTRVNTDPTLPSIPYGFGTTPFICTRMPY